jgi:DNA-directed RNA polymerase specialized sigma subunit
MTAKEYLSQAIWLDKIINNKLEEKVRLQALAEKTTSTYREDKVSGGKNTKSQMEEIIVKIIDLEHEIVANIDRFVDLKKEIMDTINQVKDPCYQLLLEMRYISNKGWDEVSMIMGYDRRWVMQLHGRALKEIDKILKKDTKIHRNSHDECDIV